MTATALAIRTVSSSCSPASHPGRAASSPMHTASETGMRTTSLWRRKAFSKISRRSAARLERVCAFLRETYPHKTADSVAADTGIAAATIRKWLEAKATPNGAAVVLLAAVYGPEFLCAVMDNPPDWMTDAGRAQARARLDDGLAELMRLREAV
jgi:DNA-binding transcriptional regulator YiaG